MIATALPQQEPDPRIVWPPGHAPATAAVFAQNTVHIAATPEAVWSVLIDCARWPRWYTHCADVSVLRGGPLLTANAKFRFKTLRFYFEPEIVTFAPPRMLVWSAHGPAGTSGAHAWYLEPTPTGCRVVTEESQRGLLLAILGRHTRRELLTIHEDWLQSLKAAAEAQPAR